MKFQVFFWNDPKTFKFGQLTENSEPKNKSKLYAQLAYEKKRAIAAISSENM